jgi:hypothetical protein
MAACKAQNVAVAVLRRGFATQQDGIIAAKKCTMFSWRSNKEMVCINVIETLIKSLAYIARQRQHHLDNNEQLTTKS